MIDFHCHLDLYPNPAAAARRADAARVYVLSVTTTPKAWRGTSALAAGRPRIRTALGLHPQIAHERHGELPLFEALLPETRYVGEVGLDGQPGFRKHADVQRRVFETVLRASARAGGRILSIHGRRAGDEVLDCLRSVPDAGLPVLHWFSGTKAQMRRAVDQGCWFSVGPAMTASESGRALVAALPQDRVLTETDGPFGEDGGRPLEPRDTLSMCAVLGRLWRIPGVEVEARLLGNLKRLTSEFEPSRSATARSTAEAGSTAMP